MTSLSIAGNCQRWRDGGHSWRHVSEGGFNRLLYDVGEIDRLAARTFVERHHYSGCYPAGARRYGLFERAELVGVAVLSVPASRGVLTAVFPQLEPYAESLELGRFVLLDRVPANAESWFLARCFELAARAGVRGVVSFSDPVPRTALDGRLVFPGHTGCIYQASNASYLSRGTARTLRLLPDGTILNDRAIQKIRAGEQGWAYSEQLLVVHGATPRRSDEDRTVWLHRALTEAGVRSFRHPGNHRYAFRIGPGRRRLRLALPAVPYPKRRAA